MTYILLSSSFVMYFCINHLRNFPLIHISALHPGSCGRPFEILETKMEAKAVIKRAKKICECCKCQVNLVNCLKLQMHLWIH